MIKKIIFFIANKNLRAMLFGFLLIVFATEHFTSIFLKILMGIIAIAIGLRPLIEGEENESL